MTGRCYGIWVIALASGSKQPGREERRSPPRVDLVRGEQADVGPLNRSTILKVTLEHRRADAIIKTGNVSAMILVERVEVTTPLGWGMYIKPAHTDTFFLIGGEGPQYAIADVICSVRPSASGPKAASCA